MMKHGTRESMEMYEMLRDSVCMIDHFTDYVSHCQDPTLRQILENQQRRLIEEYHQKVNAMQGHGIDVSNIPRMQSVPAAQQGGTAAAMAGMQGGTGMAGMQGGIGIQFGIPQTGQGQTQLQPRSRTLNDRTIALGALLFHKCGAAGATRAALEMSETHLRNLAANSSRTCIDMAYEMYRYMHQRGFYQTPETPVNFVSHEQGQAAQNYPGLQQGYPGTQQGYPGMQQNYPGMQQGYPGIQHGQPGIQNFQAGTQGNMPGQIS
jgi:spore coat protein CotF